MTIQSHAAPNLGGGGSDGEPEARLVLILAPFLFSRVFHPLFTAFTSAARALGKHHRHDRATPFPPLAPLSAVAQTAAAGAVVAVGGRVVYFGKALMRLEGGRAGAATAGDEDGSRARVAATSFATASNEFTSGAPPRRRGKWRCDVGIALAAAVLLYSLTK